MIKVFEINISNASPQALWLAPCTCVCVFVHVCMCVFSYSRTCYILSTKIVNLQTVASLFDANSANVGQCSRL